MSVGEVSANNGEGIIMIGARGELNTTHDDRNALKILHADSYEFMTQQLKNQLSS
jgi:hypothetical protein